MFIAEIPRALKHIVLFIPITIACDVLVNFKSVRFANKRLHRQNVYECY